MFFLNILFFIPVSCFRIIMLTKWELVRLIQNCDKNNPAISENNLCVDFLVDNVFGGEQHFSEENLSKAKQILGKFTSAFLVRYKSKFKKSKRMPERFEKSEESWLNTNMLSDETVGKINLLKTAQFTTVNKGESPEDTVVGRPKVPWEDASDRTKRRRVTSLGKTHHEEELLKAAVNTTSNPVLKRVIKFAIS